MGEETALQMPVFWGCWHGRTTSGPKATAKILFPGYLQACHWNQILRNPEQSPGETAGSALPRSGKRRNAFKKKKKKGWWEQREEKSTAMRSYGQPHSPPVPQIAPSSSEKTTGGWNFPINSKTISQKSQEIVVGLFLLLWAGVWERVMWKELGSHARCRERNRADIPEPSGIPTRNSSGASPTPGWRTTCVCLLIPRREKLRGLLSTSNSPYAHSPHLAPVVARGWEAMQEDDDVRAANGAVWIWEGNRAPQGQLFSPPIFSPVRQSLPFALLEAQPLPLLPQNQAWVWLTPQLPSASVASQTQPDEPLGPLASATWCKPGFYLAQINCSCP